MQAMVDDAPIDTVVLQAQPDGRQATTIAATTGSVVGILSAPCLEDFWGFFDIFWPRTFGDLEDFRELPPIHSSHYP